MISRYESKFPFPFHLRNPFIDKLPQVIRIIFEDALRYSFIRIDHHIGQPLAAREVVIRC